MTSSEREAAKAAPDFPVRLTIVVAVAFAILCALGTWQVFRLREKEALLGAIARRSHAPARPVEQVISTGARASELVFTRVEATCPGLAAAPYVRIYGLDAGRVGSRLMSACPIFGGRRTLLVDRGFVSDEVKRLPPAIAGDLTPVRVLGLLRAPDRPNAFAPRHRAGEAVWFGRDLKAISSGLGAPDPEPLFLAAETQVNPDRPEIRPLALPADIPNRHLGYVITWYGLALALAGVWIGMLRRRRVQAGQGS